MARPLRIEFPGAVYHVTARDDRREPIFINDEDRRALLEVVTLYRAHMEGVLSMSAIARELGLSISRISRLIARVEQAKGKA